MKNFGESTTKTHIIALTEGEDIIQIMIDFCAAKNIKAGFFQGIGAVSGVILLHYNIKSKRYRTEIFNEPMEIVSLQGIIAQKEGHPNIHCHGAFADVAMRVYGGHVKEAIVSVTGEIVIRESDHNIRREPDERTGLNLLHSDTQEKMTFPKHARGQVDY